MSWFVTWAIIKILWQGFVVGIGIRFVIAVIFRSDVSWGGMFRSGLIVALLHLALVLGRVYGIW
jgi:hypothetical protein